MKNHFGVALLASTLLTTPSLVKSAGHDEMAAVLGAKRQDSISCPVDPSKNPLTCSMSMADRVAIITDGSCVKGSVVKPNGSSVVGTVLKGGYTIIRSNDGSVSAFGTIHVRTEGNDVDQCRNLVTDTLNSVLNDNSRFIAEVLGRGGKKL